MSVINNERKVDFYISFPMMRTRKLPSGNAERQSGTDILGVLENRAKHELCGLQDECDINNSVFQRLKRFGLEPMKLKIFKKDEQDVFKEYPVELYSSIDIRTNMVVLTLYAIGVTIEISTLADCITRSEIMVSKGGSEYESIFRYISREYGYVKKGNPKLFATIHEDPKTMDKGLIASVLFGEQYFGDETDYGVIVDEEITGKLKADYGIAQYSYAAAYVHKNVLLQISSKFPSKKEELLYLEGMSLFYIEMLLFEEAAIMINSDKITNFMLNEKSTLRKRLNQIYEINHEYSKTLEFREMLLNYPTSSSSMKHIRTAFGTEELFERLAKNKAILQSIFDAQRDIANTWETTALNVLALIITIMTMIGFFTDGGLKWYYCALFVFAIIIYFRFKRISFSRIGKNHNKS